MRLQAGLFAAAMLLAAAPANAQSASGADFKAICLDTFADPAAAMTAADGLAGWTQDASRASTYTRMSGGSDGRVFGAGTKDYRIVSVGEVATPYETNAVKGVSTVRKCVLVTTEPFDSVGPAIEQLLPIKGKKNDKGWTWRYAIVDGQYLSLDHGSVEDAVRAGQAEKGQLYLALAPFDGGVTLQLVVSSSEATRKPGWE